MLIDKGNHRHFMAKEIHEQPEVVGHTIAHYLDMVAERVALPMKLPFDFRAIKRISIAACGTAYYAGMVLVGVLLMWSSVDIARRGLSRVGMGFMTVNGLVGIVYLGIVIVSTLVF
jgi:glucosamine 6-phosphate synthetase-like amidotransferase/phosphosugar isomerase protein